MKSIRERSNNGLSLKFDAVQSNVCNATVNIPAQFVDSLYHEACKAQQLQTDAYGFHKGTVPLSYVQENYRPHLLEHVKEFPFKYFVIDFLYDGLIYQKVLVSGEPRLNDIYVEPHEDAKYSFELSLIEPIVLHRWKDFIFKSPKRKNYKDIDRQVESFIAEEQQLMKKLGSDTIQINDWVNFNVYLVDADKKNLFNDYKENLWMKISDEEADAPFKDVFIGKSIGQAFHTNSKCFQEYFSTALETNYTFCVEIVDVSPHYYFSMDTYKKHFRLKTNKEAQKKLIEVFSFRNDISQRRLMIEEAFNVLFAKHKFSVPNHVVLRQQKAVLDAIQHNPDYVMFKNQHDFKENIRLLALKLARESIFIDQIAYNEDIVVEQHDFNSYFTLLKRPRTKEFIYFNIPETKIKSQETPLPTGIIRQCCLREKTLNHIIYHLTRN